MLNPRIKLRVLNQGYNSLIIAIDYYRLDNLVLEINIRSSVDMRISADYFWALDLIIFKLKSRSNCIRHGLSRISLDIDIKIGARIKNHSGTVYRFPHNLYLFMFLRN